MVADEQKPSQVELEKTEVLSEGYFRFERLTLRTETFAGKLSEPQKREVLRSGPAVAVLLYDPAAHLLLLIEQFRVGAYLNHLPSSWLLECVAGRVDKGETNEAAARREAKEETGYDIGKLERMGAYLSSPGISDEIVTVYLGQMDAALVGGVHGKRTEGEDIRTRVLPVEEALKAADRGEVSNIIAQVALLWFARHGEAVRQRWLA